jgi:hypothetical protein
MERSVARDRKLARGRPKNPAFLVPAQALSVIFRAKVCAGVGARGTTT